MEGMGDSGEGLTAGCVRTCVSTLHRIGGQMEEGLTENKTSPSRDDRDRAVVARNDIFCILLMGRERPRKSSVRQCACGVDPFSRFSLSFGR